MPEWHNRLFTGMVQEVVDLSCMNVLRSSLPMLTGGRLVCKDCETVPGLGSNGSSRLNSTRQAALDGTNPYTLTLPLLPILDRQLRLSEAIGHR